MYVIYGRNKHPFSLLVRLATWSRWSHVGIITPDGTHVVESVLGAGVRKVHIEQFQRLYPKTYIGRMPNDDQWESRLYEHIGKKYDLLALAGIFFRNRKWNSGNRWFCSELVAYVSGVFRENKLARVTPEMCFKITK